MAEVFPVSVKALVSALQALPGVGPKSAQRAAFQLLERDREGMGRLAEALTTARASIGHCERCRMLCENHVCRLCADPGRDSATLVIVESPADVAAMEQATDYRGRYFVLNGRLSPLDGIGPDVLVGEALEALLAGGVGEACVARGATDECGRYFVLYGRLSPLDGIGPSEIGGEAMEALLAGGVGEAIVATGATVAGEATAHRIAELAAHHGVRTTRIAYGVPVGGELE